MSYTPNLVLTRDPLIERLRAGKLYVALGDPSGKGLPAEILAAVCFTATRNARRAGEGLPGIMAGAHRAMREVSAPDQYCTMLLAEVDLTTHEAEALVAGHPPPLHVSSKGTDGQVPVSDGSGAHEVAPLPVSRGYPPISALDRNEDYQTEHHQLGPGSRLLLFSYGNTERGGGVDGMMGVEGLSLHAVENRELGVLPFVRGLLGTVRGHAEKPMDDATAVILEFHRS